MPRKLMQCSPLVFLVVILFYFMSCSGGSCPSSIFPTEAIFGNNGENPPVLPDPTMPNKKPPSVPVIGNSIEKICSIGRIKDIGPGSELYPLKVLLEPLEVPKDTPLGCYYFAENGKPNAAGDSWGTALAPSKLKEKLDTAPATGNRVYLFLLGKGRYNPTTSAKRDISFHMKNYIVIIGGWNNSYENDINVYKTILSGDIGTPNDESDNSYHVIKNANLNKSAILYGVTVSAGYANGSDSSDKRGGGMYNANSSPTIIQSIFFGNSTSHKGGAIYNSNSSPTIAESFFIGNSGYDGGAIYNNNSSPMITETSFIGNSGHDGGVMKNNYSSPKIIQSTFTSNEAYYGGAIDYRRNSGGIITRSVFISNSSRRVGGAVYGLNSNIKITHSVFSNNSAGSTGGAMWFEWSNLEIIQSTFTGNLALAFRGGVMHMYEGNMTIIQSTFTNNKADNYGGAIFAREANITIIRSTISNNSVNLDGGAIYSEGAGITIIQSTISNNHSAHRYGGGIYLAPSAYYRAREVVLANVILWGNTAPVDGEQIHIYRLKKQILTLGSVVLQGGIDLIGRVLNADIVHDNIIFDDPNIDSVVADNGGEMQTVAIYGGSSAINKGLYIKAKKDYSKFYYSKDGVTWYGTPAIKPNTSSITPPLDAIDLNTDARGFFSGRPDIGSFEYNGIPTDEFITQ